MKKIRAQWEIDGLGYIDLVPEDGGLRLGSVDTDHRTGHLWWLYGCNPNSAPTLDKAKAALLKACNAIVAPKHKKAKGVEVKWRVSEERAKVGRYELWARGRDWDIYDTKDSVPLPCELGTKGGKRAAEAALKRLLKKESKR